MRDCVSLNEWRNMIEKIGSVWNIVLSYSRLKSTSTLQGTYSRIEKMDCGRTPRKGLAGSESRQYKAGEAILSSVTKPHPCEDKWANIFCQILHQNPRKKELPVLEAHVWYDQTEGLLFARAARAARRETLCDSEWWSAATAWKPTGSIQWPGGFSRRAGGAPASIQSLFPFPYPICKSW